MINTRFVFIPTNSNLAILDFIHLRGFQKSASNNLDASHDGEYSGCLMKFPIDEKSRFVFIPTNSNLTILGFFIFLGDFREVRVIILTYLLAFELPFAGGLDAPHLLEVYLNEEFIFILGKSIIKAGSRST